MILPIFGGLSEIEFLNVLLGGPKIEGPELVQETFRSTNPPGDFQTTWSRFLHDGFAAHVQPRDQPSAFSANAGAPANQSPWTVPPAPTPDSPEIVLTASYSMDDGRYANNGWLQELPDPITKLTWDNAALISPAYAKKLGVLTGDLIQIAINEKSAGGQSVKRELVIAALVSPGHADSSVSIPLGYGRKMPEFDGLPYAGGALKERSGIAEQSGFNGYFLRTAANPYFVTAGGEGIESVQVTKVGRSYPFSITQEQFSIEGRGLVREATLEGYRENSAFAKKIPGEEELPHPPPSIYTHPPLKAPQQWGIGIDLNVCTGCSACVIACQAENNIIVGKLQVSHGRIMHWLRIDRYYASRKPYNQDRGEWIDKSPSRASADALPALRDRAVRKRLPGQRDCARRGRSERDGLQPLRRHALLLEQLPVQGPPIQFLRLQQAPLGKRCIWARWPFGHRKTKANGTCSR